MDSDNLPTFTFKLKYLFELKGGKLDVRVAALRNIRAKEKSQHKSLLQATYRSKKYIIQTGLYIKSLKQDLSRKRRN